MDPNIAKFLERFKVTLLGEDSFKKDFCEVVEKNIGFALDKNSVSENNGIIKLKIDSYLKTEINLHKEQILSDIREKYKNKLIKDII